MATDKNDPMENKIIVILYFLVTSTYKLPTKPPIKPNKITRAPKTPA